MTSVDPGLTGQTVELLQQLIRNACVNDGAPGSGEESRNAELLTGHLDGLELTSYEPLPGRRSLLVSLPGTDPDAPTVLLMGHTDVVPVSPDDWREDPFGGELIDGEVWGRGAVDMLNLTASMAVAVRELHRRGRPLRGTLKFLAVADEEAGGTWGADWITANAWDDVACDYVLTENGGIPAPMASGPKLVMTVAEKGIGWRRITVRGTPGHGSMPYGADNALVLAAEVVRRLQAYSPRAVVGELWRGLVDAMALPDQQRDALLDPGRLRDALTTMDPKLARYCHAMTHTTFSPNVIRGGDKTNIIPDRVELEVDIRTLPGVTSEDVDAMLAEALGDLAERVELSPVVKERPASASAVGTPMWDTLARRARAAHPDAEVLPWMLVGGTDAAFFRRRGVPSYGAGLFSAKASLQEFQSRFHGHDERIDVDSLGLSTQLWLDVAEDLLA
ncbi:M20/M25/M40 family metallo-hydrolase [Egicoccus halophilus]|uniref:Peptidase n=1 Tax=Egicoccus halophilus TaxID=1670830 RepID=A0A8J3ETI7_9ACTN|nr:M20/M25/M40 family metallo-hydrolase [Egicoccus halophilus]GGI09706.1 peptidase [Egicoccus halophilus]